MYDLQVQFSYACMQRSIVIGPVFVITPAPQNHVARVTLPLPKCGGCACVCVTETEKGREDPWVKRGASAQKLLKRKEKEFKTTIANKW